VEEELQNQVEHSRDGMMILNDDTYDNMRSPEDYILYPEDRE
jgi:hypothetical protein